uniref:Uncharacterized protein n=1 Tax=Schizaphis graminum TaxID=13262 RepID=A0A2S2PIC0_SCHGA
MNNLRTGCRKTGPDGRVSCVCFSPAAVLPCSGLPRASFGFFDDTLANVRCGGGTILYYVRSVASRAVLRTPTAWPLSELYRYAIVSPSMPPPPSVSQIHTRAPAASLRFV